MKSNCSATHVVLIVVWAFATILLPLQRVYAQPEPIFVDVLEPAPSPFGPEFAVVSDIALGWDIWIVNPDLGNFERLTPWPRSAERWPDWSPDGRELIFSSNRDSGSFNLWTVAVDGSNPVQLTAEPSNNFTPRWSPDGAHIAFVSDRSGKKELWIESSDGLFQQQITDVPEVVNVVELQRLFRFDLHK